MSVFKKHPIIEQIMTSDRDLHQASYMPENDDFYKKAEKRRKELIEQTYKLLFKTDTVRPTDADELKRIFVKLEDVTSDMVNTAVDYGFVAGFTTCSKLFFEMMKG